MTSALPSPEQGVWYIGAFPLRAYAFCILAGIVVAVWITQRRLADRGGLPGQALDVSAWAVPFGILGGRIYHVITTPQPYFGAGGHPLDAFKVWQGGLGIWGAIALGALGAWIGCRRKGVSFLDFVDSAAPGIAVAQALGRWGNWFNNELYGAKTDLPWGLQIHQWDQAAGRAVLDADGKAVVLGTFQPTFLYESLWCLLVALAVLVVERRAARAGGGSGLAQGGAGLAQGGAGLAQGGAGLARGQAFALYVMLYTVGRGVIEPMRTDEANHILGLRLNVWTSVVVFAGAAFYYVRLGRTATQASESHSAS